MAEIRLIDAAPLIKDGWVLEKHGVSNCVVGRKSLADVPTIDPESLRPTGQWLSYSDDKFCGYDDDGKLRYRKCRTYECCFCGRNTAVKSNYCPNCGAKMEG